MTGFPSDLDLGERGLPQPRGRFPLQRGHHRQLVDVRPGDEGLLTRAGQDHRAHVRVVAKGGESLVEISDRQVVERVQDLGPVDRDTGDPAPDLDLEVF